MALDRQVILQHEIIEQIADEPTGRPVGWVCDLLRGLGASDPWPLLRGMWLQGYIAVVDGAGKPVQAWRCEQVWRARSEPPELRITATDRGAGLI